MKPHELEALRDFAIENLIAAQRQREHARRYGLSMDEYHRRLAVSCMQTLASPISSAVERQAATLLEQLMLLALDHGYNEIESRIVEVAKILSSLTGTIVPWLATAIPETRASAKGAPTHKPVAEEVSRSSSHLLQPGRLLTTKEAAEILRKKPNTLRVWSSTQGGPIQPVKLDRELRWRSDDIIELLQPKNGRTKSRG